MRRPLVSFYLQAYNAEAYLRQSIESILNQSERNVEIILINNASTDSTGAICREYAHKDSRIIYQENEMNTVLNPDYKPNWIHPNGEYYSFLDSDDYLHPDYVKILYEAGKNHQADLVICGTEGFNNQGGRVVRKPPEVVTADMATLSLCFMEMYGSLRPLWGKLYRTEFYVEHSAFAWDKPDHLISGVDTFAVLRYLQKCKSFVSVGQTLHYYRVHDASLYSTRVSTDRVFECQCLYDEAFNLLELWDAKQEKLLNFLQDVHLASITDCMENTIRNKTVKVQEKLRVLQAIATDDLFCSYGLTDKNRETVFEAVGNCVKLAISGQTTIELTKEDFFIEKLYRVLDQRQGTRNADFMIQLLSAVCHPDNTHHWGSDCLIKNGKLMPKSLGYIMETAPEAWNRLLKDVKILRHVANGDYDKALTAVQSEALSSGLLEGLRSLDAGLARRDYDQLKSEMVRDIDNEQMDAAVTALLILNDERIFDPKGLYYKILIAWDLGDTALAIDTAEVISVFWNDDPALMELCGDIFAAVGNNERALEQYHHAIEGNPDASVLKDLRLRMEELKERG